MTKAQRDPIDRLGFRQAESEWKPGDQRRSVLSERWVYVNAYRAALRAVRDGDPDTIAACFPPDTTLDDFCAIPIGARVQLIKPINHCPQFTIGSIGTVRDADHDGDLLGLLVEFPQGELRVLPGEINHLKDTDA